MRTLVVLSLVTDVFCRTVASQTWISQLGIQGGFSRQKPAGTGQSDAIDRWELPSSGAIQPSLFVILPLSGRVGLEADLAASHTKFTEASGLIPAFSESDVRLVARADFALTSHVYLGAGAMLRRRGIASTHAVQTGIVGALGYRSAISPTLDARVEAQWSTQQKTDSIRPSNVYSLLFGISRRLVAGETHAAGRAQSFTPWRLQVGAAGGYARDHLYGSFMGSSVNVHQTVIDVPGSSATTAAPAFVDVPLPWAGGRLATEIGFDAERIRQLDSTVFTAHLAPGVNVGIYRGMYAGAGGDLLYVAQTGAKAIGFAGAHVDLGYRFAMMQPLEERIDISYTTIKPRADFPFAQNSLAALLGLALPLR